MSWPELIDKHPYLTAFCVLIVGEVLVRILVAVPVTAFRHWTLHKHGYPPEHCDVDGDFRPEKKAAEE